MNNYEELGQNSNSSDDKLSDDFFDGDSDFSNLDVFSSTPPRTRVLRKHKERKKRSKEASGNTKNSSQNKNTNASKRFSRSISANQLLTHSKNYEEQDFEEKRNDKKLLKMLRNSERDLKLDINVAQRPKSHPCKAFEVINSVPIVEGCKRFMSLYSRRVTSAKPKSEDESVSNHSKNNSESNLDHNKCPQSRIEFHKTLSLLIKMGCKESQGQNRNTRRNVSREEVLWQNELKDIIWLELQAWHADRSPTEQDDYLCTARVSVESLLTEIMNFKFQKINSLSVQSSDSGISAEICNGCISMFCSTCLEVQNHAVRTVECLMNRLEFAESLFPSSKAMGEHYPVYNSPEFTGRIKAMCLWYNTVKHLRLMLLIFGKLFSMVDTKFEWVGLQEDSGFESGSPSDSNNSVSSNIFSYNIMDFVSVLSIGPNKLTPYRKYIENMLKTRDVEKTLSLLTKLHRFVLGKAKMTLEKPEDENIFKQEVFENHEDELLRYGIWSPEAVALNLPSYKSIFLFICVVPLNMVQEFLNMRLEQKPNNPSPLSIRHLIREFKYSLQLATKHREWFLVYMSTALVDCGEFKYWYEEKLGQFDCTISEMFDSYLDYLEQWVLLEHETFPKSFLEEEWCFSGRLTEVIPGGREKVVDKFIMMLTSLMKASSKRLQRRVDELTVKIRENEAEGSGKHVLSAICHSVQSVINEEREKCVKMIAFLKCIGRKCLTKLNKNDVTKTCLSEAFVSLKCALPKVIESIESILFTVSLDKLDDIEKTSFASRSREILQQVYRFGFELYKEMSDGVAEEYREKLSKSMMHFASLWMKFATEKCERGRGMRPRWSYQGLEFLLIVCDPKYTIYLTDEEFDDFKTRMDACISHIIGSASVVTESPSPKVALDFGRSFSNSRGSSPSPRTPYRSQRSSNRKSSSHTPPALTFNPENKSTCIDFSEDISSKSLSQSTKQDRIREAVDKLDNTIDDCLKENNLIGKVVTLCKDPLSKVHIRRKFVNFSWQRGIKIGQGRFGKVYTAVNNTTGEMMAVKEISLQQNDIYTIKRTALELKILEGISHENLVKYYGLEVHKGEMLLFMEYCEEGSLENLIAGSENGLPELLVRKYTYQLLSGLVVLHCHGIVHRDIKSANIFLTDKGNRLKIGDFGCAAKIRSQVTVHGELQGFVGTQAYMAPEVFMKTNSEGHGRAADIWSVGCVVIEMASGKKPWSEYDSNYQIMFKVGMGEKPKYPDNMIEEGYEFLDLCLQHNPKDRSTALELVYHNFVKAVGNDFI